MLIRSVRYLLLILVISATASSRADPRTDAAETLYIELGHSKIINTEQAVTTVAEGDPSVAGTIVLTPNQVLINAQRPGSTSLSLLSGETLLKHYQIIVTPDLTILKDYLQMLDPRIDVKADPNSAAVVLTGTVRNRHIIAKAVEATLRYLGDTTLSMDAGPSSYESNLAQLGELHKNKNPDENRVIGMKDEESPLYTETLSTGNIEIINLLVSENQLLSASERLEKLLVEIDPSIKVTQVNGVFVLNGTVETPAKLVRALVLSNSFVGGENSELEINVISDLGGVLAGDLDPGEMAAIPDSELNVPQVPGNSVIINNRGGGFGGGGFGGGGGGRSVVLDLGEDTSPKGNLAQNVARAGVITVAEGRVVSMLKVLNLARIEIQMHIISIDRQKAKNIGFNWSIFAEEFAFANLTAGISNSANLVAEYLSSDGTVDIDAFIRALEDQGIAQTLAEPTISTLSGESASFLAGGNIPITQGNVTIITDGVAQSVAQPPVFIEYGLKLTVRPTLLENDKIGIVLNQQLIEPDPSQGIVLEGVTVPAFTQRSVSTVTVSKENETWAVAGLLSQEDVDRLTSIPWLSRIPILGKLFETTERSVSRNELIITVTARTTNNMGYYGDESLQERVHEIGDPLIKDKPDLDVDPFSEIEGEPYYDEDYADDRPTDDESESGSDSEGRVNKFRPYGL